MTAPHKAITYIMENAQKFAQAKAARVQLEEFRKSKKALLMKDALKAGIEAVTAQEREAYSHPEYQQLLRDLGAAIEMEETIKWMMEAAKMKVDVWRTESATARAEGRATE